jgi:uncharacterized repeat protein (TIGR03847 family)
MDLEQVDRITADAIGEPGDRTFYLQMRSGTEIVTVVIEKEQLRLLATSIEELLAQIERATDVPPEPDSGLEQPIDPLWRVGRLSLGYHEDLDLVLLEVEELVPEDDADETETVVEAAVEPAPEPQRVRVWATREQMLALARHGAVVVAAGRPLCQFCGNPLDPTGHTCPAMNGHGSPTG